MTGTFTVGCVQVTAGPEFEPNIAAAERFIRQAVDQGADLVCTPENVAMIQNRRRLILEHALPEDEHPALPRLRAVARETGAWLLIGSLHIRLDTEMAANRSFLIDDRGEIAARYDKIHMFDVTQKNGERYHESATFRGGDRAMLAATPWGPTGLTVCYDVRFPALYRALAQAGARFLTVPSAFTRFTGEAHWHTLLRARAIETGCFVFAPAQCGEHAGGRKTYGHSLVVDPWGEVLADGGTEPGVITAEIESTRIEDARGMVPSLEHDRAFAEPVPVQPLAEPRPDMEPEGAGHG